jgi:hypothetical protein
LFAAGDVIGPALAYATSFQTARYQALTSDLYPGWSISLDNAFIGFRLTLAGEVHYGWVEFESRPLMWNEQPRRWAYETAADTPIIIPAPGMFLPLIGVVLSVRRRTR